MLPATFDLSSKNHSRVNTASVGPRTGCAVFVCNNKLRHSHVDVLNASVMSAAGDSEHQVYVTTHTDLRDAQPVVSQLHGLRGVRLFFYRVPGLPVWTQTCGENQEHN